MTIDVKQHRLQNGLTQQEMSERLNMSRSSYANLESGRFPISKKQAKKLGEYFKKDWRGFLE